MSIKTDWAASTQILPGPEGWIMVEMVCISRERSDAIAGCKQIMATMTTGVRHFIQIAPSIRRYNPKVNEYVARARFGFHNSPGVHIMHAEAYSLMALLKADKVPA